MGTWPVGGPGPSQPPVLSPLGLKPVLLLWQVLSAVFSVFSAIGTSPFLPVPLLGGQVPRKGG